ncbi:MAG: PDZ domain-containing protein [Acidothermus sp.]|nr:PDZ domain-containing protein [Acidothermus sp.]
MRREQLTFWVCSILAIGLAVAGWQMPVPYVRLAPGPVGDTLGSVPAALGGGGKPVISISGHPTAPTSGHLYLVTVDEYGGPGEDLSLGDVFLGWWRSSDAVVPTRLLFPPSATKEQVQQQGAVQMDVSQEDAKVAALRYLGYPVQPGVEISEILASSSVKGKAEPGDVITKVDDVRVTNADDLLKVLQGHQVGDRVILHIDRYGTALDIPAVLGKPFAGSKSPSIGIEVIDSYTQPFRIDIQLSGVGGPSAGLAFALGIVDKLDSGALTGGKSVAATGTIDLDGKVGAIGGVQQKMVAAKDAGATLFLLPKDNCAEAVPAAPAGLRLVPVTTLAEAVQALHAAAGGGPLPSCPAG